DRPRPAVQSYRGAREFFKLGQEESEKLKALSQEQGCTLYMTLLAAFQTLLHRYSGQEEIIVGSPIAGRNRTEIEPLIGFFINTLVLRTDLSGGPTFMELLGRVREVTLGAYAHQEVAFEKLVDELQPRRDLSRSPLFQVMFGLQNAAGDKSLQLPGLKFSVLNTEDATTKFDLAFSLAHAEGFINGALEYNTDLFNQETIIRLLAHFQVLLQSIVEHIDRPITQLTMMSREERRQIVTEWNQTAVAFPQDTCLHQLLEAQAERVPGATAVSFEEQRLTYFELNTRANQLAHHLRALGVGPETLVGICLERSLEMVEGIFGILKAGAAYVPLDPEYPRDRLDFMAQDAGLAVLLTQAAMLEALPEYAGSIIALDTDWPRIAHHSTSNPESRVTPDNLAYLIFTSGSTGRPKGTMNTHRGICNRLFWMQAEYQLTATDRVLQKTPFSFDVSVWEFFWPSLAGAELVLAAPGGHRDPVYLTKTIREREISTLHFVPSMLQAFLEAPEVESCRSVRQVMSSGEALPVELVEKFRQRLGADLHNLYGPTEAAVDVSYWSCTSEKVGRTIPIGRPVANTQLLIFDAGGEVVPVGVAGELHIGGVQVGRGYHRRGDLTAEKFVPNAYSADPGARLYRTGDVARYQPDGAIEYLGRLDEQVKVRGFRIELGEIEGVLLRHPHVREAAVLLLSDDQGHKRLVGYIVPRDAPGSGDNVTSETRLVSKELRHYLASRLPDYMVPAVFVMLDHLPLSPSGKLDRRSLPHPDLMADISPRSLVAPRNERERVIAGIWADVLRRDQIGVHDNFFEIGGDSIISIQIVARAHKAGLRLTPKQMFQFQTVAELASAAEATDATVIAEQSIITGEVPLTPIQRWFFEQKLERREHFTQSVLFEVQERIEIESLAAVVKLLLWQHDALRLRYRNTEAGWQQNNEDALGSLDSNGNPAAKFAAGYRALAEALGPRLTAIENLPLLLIDLATVAPREHAETIERCCSLLQSSLELSAGPICRFVLFDLGPSVSQRLFIVIHHLAVDGVSWRILLDDLQSALAQQSRGLTIDLGPKSSSFQSWARRLVAHAASEECISELPYWLSAERQRVPQLNGRTGHNRFGSTSKVDSALDKEHTRALLQEAPAAYHTQINDLLIAALAEAYARRSGHRMLLVDMEGHGREDLFAEIDLSRTLGWLTTLHPVLIDVRELDGAGPLIKSVKEQLRQVPARGFNYGVLRYLSPDPEVHSQLQNMPPAQVSFNYLGQLDGVIGEQKRLRPARESKGSEQDPVGERAHRYTLNGAVVGGQLRMSWFYSPELDDRES
ncbi:MAG TPA: amino acid adenylation domain-containing protein, partial [Pyrinomonadaceae bacterium]|nr:amino acid adenylation domain-containing protein [Pyrinomonadaceae bacterium]